jgi:hypothetical protein
MSSMRASKPFPETRKSLFGVPVGDLSIVIQGPVVIEGNVNITQSLITELKKVMPGVEVIFSTWNGELTAGFDCSVVKNIDPGVVQSDFLFIRNSKRLLLSTVSGMNEATRQYCLKVRSDTKLDSQALMSHSSAASFMPNRINLLMHSTPGLIFLIDDKLQFGPTLKLQRMWSFDFDSYYSSTLMKFSKSESLKKYGMASSDDLAVEQLLCLNFLGYSIDPSDSFLRHLNRYLSLTRKSFHYVNAVEQGFSSTKLDYNGSVRLSLYILALRHLPLWILSGGFFIYAIYRSLRVRAD